MHGTLSSPATEAMKASTVVTPQQETPRKQEAKLRWVGQPVTRVDARAKVTGRARYTVDLELPDMLHAKVLHSPFAHARIVKIDTSEAEALPGVVAVITGADLPVRGGEAIQDQPFLAVDKVRYAGEPVAAVAAVDPMIAAEAIEKIHVEYEELPYVLDPLQAMEEDAPAIHETLHEYRRLPVISPKKGSNICHRQYLRKGDPDAVFATAEYVFEDTFRTQMVQHGALEPHTSIAQVDEEGNITVWTGNDGPHRLRKDLATALGVSLEKIRVIVPYLGGGFGGKGGLKTETIVVALAQRTGGRPVKLVYTREETFQATLARHPSIVKIKTAVSRDGTFLARKVHFIYDTGAYAEKGPTVVIQASDAAVGPYRIPNTEVIGDCVYTNKPVCGAYRGYGIPQVCFAHEMHLERIARALGLDPVEVRMRNAVEEGDELPTGSQQLESVGLKACLAEVADIKTVNAPAPEGWKTGWGVACGFKNTKTPSGSGAIAYLSPDGGVRLLCATVEVGQGSHTVLTQIAAEVLGIEPQRIKIAPVDTMATPFDASTTSSRSTFHMGNAVRAACLDLRSQLLALAAELLGVPVDELELKNGHVYRLGLDEPSLSIPEVMQQAYKSGMDLMGRGGYYPKMSIRKDQGPFSQPSVFWMYGAQGAHVAVDPETGHVRVLRMIAAHDVGRAINPITCQGQIEGGVVHALGQALMEEMVFDEMGQLLNGNFIDYRIPTMEDVGFIDSRIVEVPHPEGPFGAKGIGEMTTVPTAPAIAAAVYRATGALISELPLTPERVYKALQEQGTRD